MKDRIVFGGRALLLLVALVGACGDNRAAAPSSDSVATTRAAVAATTGIPDRPLPTTTAGGPVTIPPAVAPTTTAVGPATIPPAVAPTTTRANVTLEGRVIVLDPGHNGRNAGHPEEINRMVDIGNGMKACNTTGAATDDGWPEASFNWELALVTRAHLERLGATVLLTRNHNDGWGPCIDQRAAVGNDADADAVVSLHADGGPPTGSGYHVIHPASVPGLTDDIAEPSKALAIALRDRFGSTSGMPVADYVGIEGLSERDDLGGLNLSSIPAVFLEVGNMRNPADVALLADPNFRDRAAAAIGLALADFLGDGTSG